MSLLILKASSIIGPIGEEYPSIEMSAVLRR
jgi:hypothetical protein